LLAFHHIACDKEKLLLILSKSLQQHGTCQKYASLPCQHYAHITHIPLPQNGSGNASALPSASHLVDHQHPDASHDHL
jgi:hypothetical protein